MAKWPTAMGVSTDATLDSHLNTSQIGGGRIRIVDVDYDYEVRANFLFNVDGKQYRALEFDTFEEENEARAFLATVSRGSQAIIHYNPAAPSDNAVNWNTDYKGPTAGLPLFFVSVVGVMGLFATSKSLWDLRRLSSGACTAAAPPIDEIDVEEKAFLATYRNQIPAQSRPSVQLESARFMGR